MALYLNGKLSIVADGVTVEGDLIVDGEITNSSGVLTINPTTYTRIGDLSTSGHSLGADDLLASRDLEVNGTLWADGSVSLNGATYLNDNKPLYIGSGASSRLFFSTVQTNPTPLLTLPDATRSLVICGNSGRSVDYQKTPQTDPGIFVQANSSDVTAHAKVAHDSLSIGPGDGASAGFKTLTESVTIGVGLGSAGVVTAGDLAPLNSLILGIGVRVTNDPGGGAATFKVGITGSGNPDELINDLSTASDTTGTSIGDNDGTSLPIPNGAATTLTITTDANVTVSGMVVRLAVFFIDLTPPAS